MELKITGMEVEQKPIQFNYEELKNQITEKANLYANIVYDENQVKEAKADRATLNKFKSALETKRRDVKKECLKPYEEFEKQVNDLIEIISAPILMIDSQIKDYEAAVKSEKASRIGKLYSDILDDTLYITLDDVMDQHKEWLNKTVSLKKIKEEMEEIKKKVASDIETIRALPNFAFEAENDYRTHLDLGHAIQKGQRLADIQKRKAEAEAERKRREAEEQERREELEKLKEQQVEPEQVEVEVVEEPQVIIHPAPVKEEFEPKQWITFKAYVTIEQAGKIGDFCRDNGIELEV